MPAGRTKEPFIDAEDIADVVVEALSDASHIGQLYEVTGPRLLTFADAIGEIAEASCRRIRYKEILADEYASLLEKHEVPSEYVSLVMYLFTTVLDGRTIVQSASVSCSACSARCASSSPRPESNTIRLTPASRAALVNDRTASTAPGTAQIRLIGDVHCAHTLQHGCPSGCIVPIEPRLS